MTVRTAIAAACVTLLVSAAGAQTAVGWRGDGSGCYPNAMPPVKWGRLAKSILELRAHAAKPREGDTGEPIPDGVIRTWLVLGPVPIPEGKKLKDDFLPDEADLAPLTRAPRLRVGDSRAEPPDEVLR